MNPGLLDVLLNPGNHTGRVIRQRIDIELGRLLEKLVDQDGTIMREVHRGAHVVVQSLFVVDDRHSSASKNITWSDEHRIPDPRRNLSRLRNRGGGAVFR